jgi:hypothetical protein
MPKFLNATQARGEIESILTKAKTRICMISPYLRIHDDLIARLTDAGNRRQVKITIVCREKDLRDEERHKLQQIKNLELHFNHRVHAKCYYNEDSMVIASLSLYDSSQGDNHEMGIVLSNKTDEDKEAFQDAVSEAAYIVREAPKAKGSDSLESFAKDISKLLGIDSKQGYCIRCGNRVTLDTNAPYCPDCYRVWAKYKKNDFEEEVCHSCGKKAKTSMSKPLCSICYTQHRRKM